MSHFKRRKTRRCVRCTLCTQHRWTGNAKRRRKAKEHAAVAAGIREFADAQVDLDYASKKALWSNIHELYTGW